jgi:hypothetical protein
MHMESRKHKFMVEALDNSRQDQRSIRRYDRTGHDRPLAGAIVQIDLDIGCR